MKKNLFFVGLALCLSPMVNAQVIDMSSDEGFCMIPSGFTTDSKAKICIFPSEYDSEKTDEELKVRIYDESFNVVSAFKLKLDTYISYEVKQREWNKIEGKYNGDWSVDEEESTMGGARGIYFYDLISTAYNAQDNDGVYLTQTLFNTDTKYEYAYPREILVEEREEKDRDGDGEIDYVRINRSTKYEGVDILSEDGNVVASYTFSEKAKETDAFRGISGFIFKEKKYLAFYMEDYDNYEFWYEIYPIGENGSQVTRIFDNHALMRLIPAMPRKDTSVTVEFGEESVKDGGELMITDMNGRTVYRNVVAPGETSVKVPMYRMVSGIYNVTLTNDGQNVETSKLIVR